jgi:hypothetical protein
MQLMSKYIHGRIAWVDVTLNCEVVAKLIEVT